MLESRQILILSLFCAVYVAWGLTDSIQAPFYPIEAERKGATVSEYGFVFGIIHLAIFFSGPFFGKYMHFFGLKNVYIFGVISTGVCALLFGFLDFVEDKVLFLTYSYTLRILEGVAEAASWSAVFSMLLQMFPDNVATVYSFTEASFSFSEMVGPTVGAIFYSIGGFVLPFEICGVLCLVTVPEQSILNNNTEHRPEHQTRLLPVLKNMDVILALTGTVYAASIQGLLEACLEPYLEQFHLTITKVGLTFLALSVPYFMASPLWGYCCDHLIAPEYIQAVGTTIILIGFIVFGPAPYLPMEANYPMVVIGLAFLGIGTAAGLVASFSGAQKAALMRQDMETTQIYTAISGIWTSSFALGNFIGPSLGGFLYDFIGFRTTTFVFQVVGVVMLFLDLYKIKRLRNGLVFKR
eukprot:maker-scaffold1312_size48844-snap-gene-0.9 protein:Tk02202 transcript:maker-scaffold1312_size48844-snap-gene-0.9-mRNA-1 annotation:"mfs-type transporter slc18b1-like"